ncbi:MAG: alpha/beta hydrolase [Acidimicrobiales bacterium]|nr:alpha/beta hydrolase [Acidimicrobiales bacterium]
MSVSSYRLNGLAVYSSSADKSGLQIVLVHGAVDRAAGMIRIARKLNDLDVVRYDRRGYGRSESAPSTLSFEKHLADLEVVVGGRPTVLFGHSYGGSLALAAAARGSSNICATVVYEAPRGWEDWWPPPPSSVTPEEAAQHFVRRMVGETRWSALPEVSRARIRDQGERMVFELQTQMTQRYDAASISTPLLVGVGELSGEHAHRAARLAADEAPNGELFTVAEGRHDAPMTHPHLIADLLRQAIARPR